MFQKTVAINDFYLRGPDTPYPLGQIQSQGRTHGVMAQTVVPWIPLWAYDAWVARGVDWLAMSEDLPRAENRVTVDAGRPHPAALPAEQRRAHTSGWSAKRSASCGASASGWSWRTRTGARTRRTSAARSCFGTDPRASVLDPFCRTHDVENLFVVDASFFPSSAAVNPGLTIAAQALRVADHITETHLA